MKDFLDERTLLAFERTQLALERTFLAWIRTGLAGIVGGVALIRFVEFKNIYNQYVAYTAGVLFVFWGIYLFILGMIEYERSIKQLRKVDPYLKVFLGRRRAAFALLFFLSLLLLLLVLKSA